MRTASSHRGSADGILIATLNRPEKLNALNLPKRWTLLDGAQSSGSGTQPELKVMLIRATGRYFCAGRRPQGWTAQNIPHLSANAQAASAKTTGSTFNGMHRSFGTKWSISKSRSWWPIQAHVRRRWAGTLALSCDFRLASKSAGYAFSFPEGLVRGAARVWNGVSRLTRVCGPHWARWLIMANQKADAEKALVMGLVHEVLPDEEFEAAALAFCRHLTKNNPEQMGAAKIAIDMAAEVGRDTARHVERLANSALMLNPAYLEGVERYVKGIGKGE